MRPPGSANSSPPPTGSNAKIMLRLQEEGLAVPMEITMHGRHCPGAAINHHRIRPEDPDPLIEEMRRPRRELAR